MNDSELREAMLNRSREIRKSCPNVARDLRYIYAAKDVAKQYNVNYQDLLKMFAPDANIKGSSTWDVNGKVYRV